MTRPEVKVRPLIGWREWVVLPEVTDVPIKAKVDTGARTSSLHAFGLTIHERDGQAWAAFDVYPHQRSATGRSTVSLPISAFKQVTSSSGHSESRPVIRTPVRLGRRTFTIDITLTSRDEMGFRMLLGRSAIRRRFWVAADKSFLHPANPAPNAKRANRP